jgi:hypothetical protein
MRWWYIAVDALAATVVAWLLLNLLASILRACGVTWARLPNLDYLGKWLSLALSFLALAPWFDWRDPVLRNIAFGYGAFCLVFLGMWIYGRLFVLPKLKERHATPPPAPPDRINRGIFKGWSARVARRTCAGLALFVAAGSAAGELLVHGYTVFGALAAAVALYCAPFAIIVMLLPLFHSAFAHRESEAT